MQIGTDFRDALPASVMQQQFWVLNRFAPDSPAYNIPMVNRIEGHLDCVAMEQALNELVRRHAIFRVKFWIDASGTLMQSVSEWEYRPLPVVDLSASDLKDFTATTLDPAVNNEVRRPFDLAAGPQLRFKLFRNNAHSWLLAITAHHIVFDLATRDWLAGELSEEYRAALEGRTRTDVPEYPDYGSFSIWQERWMQSSEMATMADQWLQYLEGHEPALNLPAGQMDSSHLTTSGNVVTVRLDGDDFRKIRTFCREAQVGTFLVLLTAWAWTLARYSRQDRLTVGVPFTNRRSDEFKRTPGCFVNILPLTFDISDDPSLRESLRRVRRTMLQMHRMQEMPYYHLVQLMRRRRAGSAGSLFRAGFTFVPPMRLHLEGLKVEPVDMHNGGSQLDLFVTFREESGGIAGAIEYDPSRIGLDLVDRIAETLLGFVNAMVEESDKGAA